MIKIIWALIALNSLVLLIFIGSYFVINHGRHVSYEEKGWTIVLSSVGMILILLAAIPLRFSQSTGTLIFSGLMSALPICLAIVFSLVK